MPLSDEQLQEKLTELIWANFPAWEDTNDPGRLAEAMVEYWQPAVEAAVRADQIERDAAIAESLADDAEGDPYNAGAREAAAAIRAQQNGDSNAE